MSRYIFALAFVFVASARPAAASMTSAQRVVFREWVRSIASSPDVIDKLADFADASQEDRDAILSEYASQAAALVEAQRAQAQAEADQKAAAAAAMQEVAQ